jgi:hypothetical protein
MYLPPVQPQTGRMDAGLLGLGSGLPTSSFDPTASLGSETTSNFLLLRSGLWPCCVASGKLPRRGCSPYGLRFTDPCRWLGNPTFGSESALSLSSRKPTPVEKTWSNLSVLTG